MDNFIQRQENYKVALKKYRECYHEMHSLLNDDELQAAHKDWKTVLRVKNTAKQIYEDLVYGIKWQRHTKYAAHARYQLEYQIRRKIIILIRPSLSQLGLTSKQVMQSISKEICNGDDLPGFSSHAELIELIRMRDSFRKSPSWKFMLPFAEQFVAEITDACDKKENIYRETRRKLDAKNEPIITRFREAQKMERDAKRALLF